MFSYGYNQDTMEGQFTSFVSFIRTILRKHKNNKVVLSLTLSIHVIKKILVDMQTDRHIKSIVNKYFDCYMYMITVHGRQVDWLAH